MKVVIIEDEAPAFRRLQKLLEEVDPEIEILEVFDSVDQSIEWFRQGISPDLIFMDIQLSDGVSFDIFESVKIKAPIVFTTAFDEYMLKAFKVNSIDYLLKPIDKNDLKSALEKLKNLKESFAPNEQNGNPELHNVIREIQLQSRSYKNRFLVKMGDKLLAIPLEEVAFFYTHNAVVYLVTIQGKKYIQDNTLDEIQQQLNPDQFYRANRQYILNLEKIAVVHRYHKGKLLVELLVPHEEQIIVSAEKATDFKSWFGGNIG